MKDKIGKYLNLTTILGSIVVISAIVYYGIDFYKHSEFKLEKSQFNFFVIFGLVIIWIIVMMYYKMIKLNQALLFVQQSNIELKKNDEDIKSLINIIREEQLISKDEQLLNHDSNIKLHQNTRKLFLEALSNKEGVE